MYTSQNHVGFIISCQVLDLSAKWLFFPLAVNKNSCPFCLCFWSQCICLSDWIEAGVGSSSTKARGDQIWFVNTGQTPTHKADYNMWCAAAWPSQTALYMRFSLLWDFCVESTLHYQTPFPALNSMREKQLPLSVGDIDMWVVQKWWRDSSLDKEII